MPRPTNRQLCDEFRHALTHGVRQGPKRIGTDEEFLAASKDWRGDLWRRFKVIEERLCPTVEIEQRLSKEEK